MGDGTTCPSVYDVRLSMRASLDEGFRKFSFGNVWVSVEGLPEDKIDELGKQVADMKSTGNRILTNLPTKINLEIPTRTEAYDKFIENMRNEFYMSLGDPTIKLGLEMGYTKATSETAADLYKFKVSTFRQCIKHHLENLFVQILDKLGYDGRQANVQMNFERVETPQYESKEIFEAVKDKIITRNEARKLLSKYAKWDITGDIEGGDKPVETKPQIPFTPKEEGVALIIHEKNREKTINQLIDGLTEEELDSLVKVILEKIKARQKKESIKPEEDVVEVRELSDALAGYNEGGKIYIDPLALANGYPKELLVAHEKFEWNLVVKFNMPYEKAHLLATEYEHQLANQLGMDWNEITNLYEHILPLIEARGSTDPNDLVRSDIPVMKAPMISAEGPKNGGTT